MRAPRLPSLAARLLLILCLATAFTSAARTASAVEAPAARHGRVHHAVRGIVNLNQADQETLELLPGIGEVKATRIITYRKSHPFKRIDDLTRVKGIGRKTLARLRPYLGVTGGTTLHEEVTAPE